MNSLSLCSRHYRGRTLGGRPRPPPSHTEVRLRRGDAHVQSMGRNWGMCTSGHLLQICSPNDHRGGLRLILKEAWGTMCVPGTYFKLKVTCSVQPYVMKTVIALMGSVLIMMNIQYVFSWVHWICQRSGILWHKHIAEHSMIYWGQEFIDVSS